MLFNGKCNVQIDTYNPGKSISITVFGPSGKGITTYASLKAYPRFSGEESVAKPARNRTTTSIDTDDLLEEIRNEKPGRKASKATSKKATKLVPNKKALEAELKKLMAQLKK